MTDAELITIVKLDLQQRTNANDEYLGELIRFAQELMKREGITVSEDDHEARMIQAHYTAYLFRKRAGQETSMPRFLRYELNNLLFAQKGKSDDV